MTQGVGIWDIGLSPVQASV